MERLKKEPVQVKLPNLFELCRDKKGVVWCGLTVQAEDLIEEIRPLEYHSKKVAKHVTRLLMMFKDRRIPVDKMARWRRDMGLPYVFRTRWIHMFSEPL